MSSKGNNNIEEEFNPETPEEIESAISECLKKSGFTPPENLLGLIKLFLLPKRPIDDSKLEVSLLLVSYLLITILSPKIMGVCIFYS